MIYVLDTTTVSALMVSHAAVSARLLATDPGDVFIPQPVLGEIRYGLARLPRSKRRAALEGRLDLVLASVERAAWDDVVSARFGEIKARLEAIGTRVDDSTSPSPPTRWCWTRRS